jgi:hypothetical protein
MSKLNANLILKSNSCPKRGASPVSLHNGGASGTGRSLIVVRRQRLFPPETMDSLTSHKPIQDVSIRVLYTFSFTKKNIHKAAIIQYTVDSSFQQRVRFKPETQRGTDSHSQPDRQTQRYNR